MFLLPFLSPPLLPLPLLHPLLCFFLGGGETNRKSSKSIGFVHTMLTHRDSGEFKALLEHSGKSLLSVETLLGGNGCGILLEL